MREGPGGDLNIFEMMTSTLPKGTLGSVASLLAANLLLVYRINREKYTPYAGAAGTLLHINGKFTMGKLKSFHLS